MSAFTWLLFAHSVPSKGKEHRPMLAMHVVDVSSDGDVGEAPACGALVSFVADPAIGGGYVLACCRCLGISESRRSS